MTSTPSYLLPGSQIELIHSQVECGKIRYALFDFDGTLSTFREGWQAIMHQVMMEYLLQTPRHEESEQLAEIVREAIAISTGKQTIYQMITLREMVAARGGDVLEATAYKAEFTTRLMNTIHHRIDAVASGQIDREDMLVPGSIDLLEALQIRGVQCYLASGSDEVFVKEEVEILGLTHYFNGVHGAQEDYINHSKRKVIERMLRDHQLSGSELVGFGDGFVEIEDVKHVGGIAIGVASDEVKRSGIDEWKRNRLIQAGADVIVPDYREVNLLLSWLFSEG